MYRTRNPLIIFLALPILILAIGLTGCNSGTEEPDAPAAPETSSATTDEGGDMEAAAAAADTSGRPADEIDPSRIPDELPEGITAAVPDNFPEDLPVYPGAVPAQGKSVTMDDNDLSAVQFLSNDSPDAAFDTYVRDLESKGWVVNPDAAKASDNNIVEVTKGDCKATMLFAPAEGADGTDIFTVTECGS